MANWSLLVLQFVHIFFAAILIGSSMFMDIVLWPTLLKLNGVEAKEFYEKSLKRTSVLMAASGGITFLTGILRGTVFGDIRSWDNLKSSYGITFSIALLATLAMLIHGPRIAPHLFKEVWDGKNFAPEAKAIVHASHVIPMIAVFIILLCMVLMRCGVVSV